MKLSNVILALLLFSAVSLSQNVTIKFATIAPDGSTWMNVMKEFSQDVLKATDGKVKFKIYAGGVQGDEKDVLRKIRFKQLHSAGFTGVGLGEILPEVRIFDSPFLFHNHDEIDYVSNKFFDSFAEKFEKKGYILLGWAEIGFVYIYTNTPVKNTEDFKGVKMWMWEGDPLAEATFKAFGINPIPLSITDVLTSLQTGLIDGVYTSPLACVGLQWFTKIKYVTDVALSNSNGAVLVSKNIFNKLNSDQQKIVKEKARHYFTKLVKLSREDNKKSTEEMLKNGVKKIEITDTSILNEFEMIGKQARKSLVGKLYDQALLDQIEKAVEEFRKNQNNGVVNETR